jgi:hypothetical protein
LQHQSFFASDHPVFHFAKPAAQSKRASMSSDTVVFTGADVVVVAKVVVIVGQPLPCCLQHHSFFPGDQPFSHFNRPAAQSKGNEAVIEEVQRIASWLQQYAAFASDHLRCASSSW